MSIANRKPLFSLAMFSPYLLPLILSGYALLALAYALRTPAWQAPDEPAHFNYIAAITSVGCCPILSSGDWDGALLNQLTSERFLGATPTELTSLRYENHQPPLYYVLASPLFRLSEGSLTALRLGSALLGMGVVINTHRCARLLAPKRPIFAHLAALFCAFLPQQLHILSSVNNDALAWLLISETIYLCLALLYGSSLQRECRVVASLILLAGLALIGVSGETLLSGLLLLGIGTWLWRLSITQEQLAYWLLGSLIGVIFITKLTAYLMLPVALATHFSCGSPHRRNPRSLFHLLLPATLIGATWWLRNIQVYGWPDIFALQIHERVVVGQMRSADQLAQQGWLRFLIEATRTTFISFWGQFGWMSTPLSGWRFFFIVVQGAVCLLGALAAIRHKAKDLALRPLVGLSALTIAMFILYNLAFVQWQGRYLYPALIPVALAWSWGVFWIRQRLGFGSSLLLVASLPGFALEIWLRVLPSLNP